MPPAVPTPRLVTVIDDDGGTSPAFVATDATYGGIQSPDGILQPINYTGPRSLFKHGSVVPVKLRVADCAGLPIGDAVLQIRVQKLSGYTPSGTDEAVASAGSANTDGYFRYDASKRLNTSTTFPPSSSPTDATSSWRIFVDAVISPTVTQADIVHADIGLKK